MTRHLLALCLLTAVPAFSEVAVFQESESQTTYEPIFNLSYSVDHPFRFVHGQLSMSGGGVLVTEPGMPARGAKFDLSISPSRLTTGDTDVDKAVATILHASADQPIEFHSRGTVVTDDNTVPHLHIWLVGHLTIAGVTRTTAVPLACTTEDKFIQCMVQFQFALTDFGITPPRFLGIPARDRVQISGDVVFKPKG